MKFTVYIIKGPKKYIGITSKAPYKRWNKHKQNAKSGTNQSPYLYRAIRKYGEKAFYFKILKSKLTKKQAIKYEKDYIKKFNTFAPYGYNLTLGGEGGFGRVLSKLERNKISIRKSKAVIRSDGKVYKNTISAAKSVNGFHENIIKVIYGKINKAYGYSWKYLKNDPIQIRNKNRQLAYAARERTIFKRRKVKCLTTNKIYNTITAAAKDWKCSPSNISSVCRGRRKSCKGAKFKYVK